MKQTEQNQKIKHAFDAITPNVLESVLSDCDKNRTKGTVFMMQQKNRRPLWNKIAAIAAAIVLIVSGAFVFGQYQTYYTPDALIALDINPSIEITVNRNEKVLDVKARNEEAKTVIGTMDFKGSTLDLTVNALIGSMLRNGYLNEITNAILISVESNDPQKGAQLQEKLTNEVNTLLQTDTFDAAILSQYVPVDATLKQQAETYGISDGKVQLINQITNGNNHYTVEDLAPLSITELSLLANAGNVELSQVESVGTASEKAYIGREKAKQIVAEHLGLSVSDLFFEDIELDYENGRMVYEIECYVNGREYDYDIHAVTGEITKGYTANQNTAANEQPVQPVTIDEARIKNIILEHAGLTETSLQNYRIRLTKDDGRNVYDIEFYANGYEYDYEIDAESGKIRDYDREKEVQPPANAQPTNSTVIGKDAAKAAALAHAALSENEIAKFKIEQDRDDGRNVYEIEFHANGYEYDYEINAHNGDVLKSEKERED